LDGDRALFFKSNSGKIFVIGHNKTATTSVAAAIASMGFKLGNQPEAELLIDEWAKRDFRKIVKYCRTAEAFKDIPFSLDYTYQVMDYAFPGSKFILTIRNSSLEWYESLTRAHTLLIGKNRLPTADDLKTHPYREPGWLWRALKLIYGMEEKKVYDRQACIGYYEAYNARVIDYFRHRRQDLLILNAADADAMKSMCGFLGVDMKDYKMPHLKKSKDIV
jgi:hypothetical protein